MNSVIEITFFTKQWLKIKMHCGSQNFEPFILKQRTTLNKSLNKNSSKSLKA